ncbi:MAG: FG-GAP repeat domain-containing protein, partial [Oscillospiraceae bacterium]
MKLQKALLTAFLAGLMLLSGCSLTETEELYSLPQPSKEYLQLQKLIDAEIASGCEYAAPTAGSQRQSVQLTDLNGDGTNEAVAFLRNQDLQPIICVYRKTNGEYALEERIAGNGSAVGRVEYADLDGDGNCEIVVSWEAASEMQLMTAYKLSGGTASELLRASCIDFQT